jgi:5-methylcytosine-specific restriction endonuclease McrA
MVPEPKSPGCWKIDGAAEFRRKISEMDFDAAYAYATRAIGDIDSFLEWSQFELDRLAEKGKRTAWFRIVTLFRHLGKEHSIKKFPDFYWVSKSKAKMAAKAFRLIFKEEPPEVPPAPLSANCESCGARFGVFVDSWEFHYSLFVEKAGRSYIKNKEEFVCGDCRKRRRGKLYGESRKRGDACLLTLPEEEREKAQILRNMPYRKYLKTDHWTNLREAAKSRAGNRCQLCNNTGMLNVHHRTYDRRGFEELADLTVLCERCHNKFHEIIPDVNEHEFPYYDLEDEE